MAQQPFTEIDMTKKRYEVVVIARNAAYGCDRCDDNLDEDSFTCPCCHRVCCEYCAEENASHFGNRQICTDCARLPVTEQLRIAAFAEELNK